MNLRERQKSELDKYLEMLQDEERLVLEEKSLTERIAYLAEVTGKKEEDVFTEVAAISGLEIKAEFEVKEQIAEILPLRIIHEYQCLPIKDEEAELALIVAWPPSSSMKKWLYAVCGVKPKFYLTTGELLVEKITEIFGVGFQNLESSDFAELEEAAVVEEDEDAAIIRFVNEIIQKALEDRATDIHFEPQKNRLQIRYRIDGELIPVQLPEQLVKFQAAIISRLKIMSRLNISERRRPQDGRIKFSKGLKDVDIRVSTFPTNFGESVSLRLLNQGAENLSLEQLGLLPDDQKKVEPIVLKPHGIILVTGPTGSGKSTTLGAFLQLINSPERRIITVEDPIENEIAGINQTQVQPEIGLTFASALRHILRQDPDVIMVGEIRDRETADIGIRASLTGHLVMSTLHTNDSAGALTRLIDMEIEPFLLASSVELIVAQRLVRKLCPKCARPAQLAPGELKRCLEALKIDASEVQHADKVLEPVGCKDCHGLGYRGRIGIYEVLVVDDTIHKMIIKQAPAREMRDAAISAGMRTLQECGWEHVKSGKTTLKAIMKYAELTEEE